MKTQRVRVPETGAVSWIVLGDDFRPILPILAFLQYLVNLEKSPNTVRNYAQHLKLYWEYLRDAQLQWTGVHLKHLAAFVAWLREPEPGIIRLEEQEARRTETTINTILAAVASFYDFHQRDGTVSNIPLYRTQFQPHRRYKGFLHHISKHKGVRSRLIKLRPRRTKRKTLTQEQINSLVAACHRTRDKFLLRLLYDTGMRIGQALGLRHEDIVSWDNEIRIVPRDTNANGVRAKSYEPYVVHVDEDLMGLYTDYLLTELADIDSDYVFVNLWDGQIGAPMTYSNTMDLFRRLTKRTGISIHPHLLRHTHATDLIRAGWDAARVQKRLGHASIQTTLNIYTHLDDDDLKKTHQIFSLKRTRK